MNKTPFLKSVVILFVILIIASSGYAGWQGWQKTKRPINQKNQRSLNNRETPKKELNLPITKATSTEEIDINNYGTIKGHINYPKPDYKEAKTCAENIDTKEKYCTNDYKLIKTETGEIKEYEIKASEGKYYVYTIDPKGRKGYYSELAECGLKTSCTNTELIVVNVHKGETITGVNPLDWYTKR